jgi:hypothetical protein
MCQRPPHSISGENINHQNDATGQWNFFVTYQPDSSTGRFGVKGIQHEKLQETLKDLIGELDRLEWIFNLAKVAGAEALGQRAHSIEQAVE